MSRADTTVASAPPGAARPIVDTEAAAEALRITATTLHRFTRARIVTPARVDPDGSRSWNLAEPRAQLAVYLDKNDVDAKPTFG